MTNGDILDGWKSISTFVGKSVKTVQRWERESDFPIHRVPGRRSVFAMKAEVNVWLSRQTDGEEHSANGKRRDAGQVDWLFRPRRVSPVFLALIILALGVIAARKMGLRAGNTPVLGPLTVKIAPYSQGSLLTVRNGLGNLSLQRRFDYNWFDFAKRTPGSCMWHIVDLNGDGLDDFLLAAPEKSVPMIDVYLQDSKGRLNLERSLHFSDSIDYQGKVSWMGRIESFTAADLDGDGVPELIALPHHASKYPALLMVTTLQGEPILTMEHPGRLNGIVQVRHVDRKVRLYISGTNNFITKYSEPVVMRLSMDWHRRGLRFSLMRPGRHMVDTIPMGVALTYARLGSFPPNAFMSMWERAVIRLNNRKGWRGTLLVEAGYYDTRKGTAVLPGGGLMAPVRMFELAPDLSLVDAEFADIMLGPLDIHPKQEPYRSLLKPHYWNGHDWQDTVCTVPCESTAQNVE